MFFTENLYKQNENDLPCVIVTLETVPTRLKQTVEAIAATATESLE